jgi:hypothetical protein
MFFLTWLKAFFNMRGVSKTNFELRVAEDSTNTATVQLQFVVLA